MLTAALMTAGLTVASGTAGAVAGFGDIGEKVYYTEAVQWMVNNKITYGTSATCFSPGDPVTRGQAAAFMWRMEGEPTAPPHSFTDVVAPWQQAPVSWMDANHITSGTTATTYSPDDVLTRGQLAALLWRLAGRPAASGHPFTDVHSPWQQAPVAWMVSTNPVITSGTTATTFSPDDTVTRGQLATFFWRYKGEPTVTVDKTHPTTPTCAQQVPGPNPSIVFVRDNSSGSGSQIMTMNFDGSGVTQLTTEGLNQAPDWSPDGSRIAYEFVGHGIWVMDADGSANHQVVTDRWAGDPSWSPNGTEIVFWSKRDGAQNGATSCGDWDLFCRTNLFIVSLDTGTIRQVTFSTDDINMEPAWSPSGEMIAFVSDRDNDWEIFTVLTDGSGITQRTFNDRADHAPNWDHADLVYTSYFGTYPYDFSEILSLIIYDGFQSKVTNLQSSVRYPSTAPDTGILAYALRPRGSFNMGDFEIVIGQSAIRTGQAGYMPDVAPGAGYL